MASSQNREKTKKASNLIQAPRGMHDVLPVDQGYWDRVSKIVKDLSEDYGFNRIDTPILEQTALFERGVGEGTDIVEKEMYSLKTKGGDALSLRPENTAGVVRSYLENGLGRMGQPQKLYYSGPMFRHETPQQYRPRQFTQIGFEIIGVPNDPIFDATLIVLATRLLEELKIKDTVLRMNSIGCRVCRPAYVRQLQNYYRPHEKSLCKNCSARLKLRPLRLLDCKEEKCQELKENAPSFLDKLCSACSSHLKNVLEYLEEVGVPYTLDKNLVRGLDYYSRTVFEVALEGQGSQIGALPGGGRYDYLIEMLGGRPTPAVGFAVSYERLIAAMKLQEVKLPEKKIKKVFVAHAGELAKKKALRLVEDLRHSGIPVAESLARESLGAQLKVANRENAAVAVILGQKEVYEGSVIIRDMRSGLQESCILSKMLEELKKRLKAAEQAK